MTHFSARFTLSALSMLALAPFAHAGYTETFEAAPLSNAGYYSGVLPGTALEVIDGPVFIGAYDGPAGRTQFLDLASGWYAANFDSTGTHLGSTAVQSTATFDLLAGYTYTLSFDYSRQGFSAGNGPFFSTLTASLGSQAVSYSEEMGFYYPIDFKPGLLQFTALADQPGARVMFVAQGPDGYSGMLVDNVSMIGVAPVPEPASVALFLAGIGVLALARRRRSA